MIQHYNDWIRVTKHGAGLDAFYTVEVCDLTGNWQSMRRFDEDDEWCTSKKRDYIQHLLYQPRPVRHVARTV